MATLHPLNTTIEPDTILVSIDTLISEIDAKIARLSSQKEPLELARSYIRSSHIAYSITHHPPARRPSSTPCREAILRSVLEREKSPSPPESRGLLASEDFEAAFEREGDVVVSVEQDQQTATTGTLAPVPAAISDPGTALVNSDGNSAAGVASMEPVCGKCVIKRNRQANAAKAREARKRKLNEATLEVI